MTQLSWQGLITSKLNVLLKKLHTKIFIKLIDISLLRVTWAPILHAASIWFSQGGGMENISAEKVELDVTG